MESLFAIIVFSLVHIYASGARKLGKKWQGRILSAGGGVSIAYIFIDVLPKLGASELVVKNIFAGFFPYFERHVYVFALAGFILFFLVDRAKKTTENFYLSLASYSLLNILIGYAVSDKDDPEVQPLLLFTFAIALHYFINDYSLSEKHPKEYNAQSRWVLIASLFLGWGVGQFLELSPAAVALVGAFIAGGVIMNVIRHELPKDHPHSTSTFIYSAIFYTFVLLSIGRKVPGAIVELILTFFHR